MNFSQFFKDGNGNLSATRLAFLAWAFGMLVAWLYVSWQKQALQALDSSLITALGILMTGKVAQSFSPNDGPATAPGPAQVVPPAQPAIVGGPQAVAALPPARVAAG
jgi:hypothetical protein